MHSRQRGRPQKEFSRDLLIAFLIGLSVVSTLLVARSLFAFDRTVGSAGRTPRRWPASSRIQRSPGRSELLLFAHLYCSCTPATISELSGIHTRMQPEITVLIDGPARTSGSPAAPPPESPVLRSVQALPGAHVLWDSGGTEAQRFGARTSGFVVLYSAAGDLLFDGGVTGSRGHEGDNPGLDELVSALDSGSPVRRAAPVFGCALVNHTESVAGLDDSRSLRR